ncbi:MAG: addiction module component CHP02574 family protein [Flavobacteriaceae bacterium]
MRTQVIQDHNGKPTGIFIPIEDWENIKKNYPDIENTNDEFPQWQKDILDLRLADLNNPEKIKPIENLFEVLDQEL